MITVATRPLLKLSPLFRNYTLTADKGAHVYNNRTCGRTGCTNPKSIASASLWCVECNALDTCDECGDAVVDCTVDGECCGYDGGNYVDEAKWERQQMGITS